MNLHRWLRKHSLKLLAIRDTPQAIAGGVAIGVFFGFTPLFGIKTISAIIVAWLTGSNILAAVIAGAMHDLILPLMPAVYLWEYDVGYWILSRPHILPPAMHRPHWEGFDWRAWTNFLFGAVGKRLLVGGMVCATPFAALAFGLTHLIVSRHQLKRQLRVISGEPPRPAP